MSWLGRLFWQRVHDPRLIHIEREVDALKQDMVELKAQTAELVEAEKRRIEPC